MVHRGNKRYFYRSVRVGNRVTKVYLGKQEQADAAQAEHKREQEERATRCAQRKAEQAAHDYCQLLIKGAILVHRHQLRLEGWHFTGGEFRVMSKKVVRRQPKDVRRAIRAHRLALIAQANAKAQLFIDQLNQECETPENVFYKNEEPKNQVQNLPQKSFSIPDDVPMTDAAPSLQKPTHRRFGGRTCAVFDNSPDSSMPSERNPSRRNPRQRGPSGSTRNQGGRWGLFLEGWPLTPFERRKPACLPGHGGRVGVIIQALARVRRRSLTGWRSD